MIKQIFVLFFLFFKIYLAAQYGLFPKTIDSAKYQSIMAELSLKYGQNKSIPEEFELQTLIALSRYPELVNLRIEFKQKRIKTTMACRPSFGFIFKKKSKRSYKIFINNHTIEIESVWLKNLSFNAQIGVIAHELAHVVDYMKRTNLQIVGVGMNYGSVRWRSLFEKSIDSIAISRGFAWQLYEFSNFIQSNKVIPEDYRNYKKKTYYSPDYILFKISEAIINKQLRYFHFLFPK